MAVAKMQFKDYVFKNNPKKIEVSCKNRLNEHFSPTKGNIVESLGAKSRVVRCEGELFGNTAQSTINQLYPLLKMAEACAKGCLFLPSESPFTAYLSEFKYQAAGDGRVISYYAEFVESFV